MKPYWDYDHSQGVWLGKECSADFCGDLAVARLVADLGPDDVRFGLGVYVCDRHYYGADVDWGDEL